MATGTITKVSNDSTSNYCKMPDGTLICWGMGTISSIQGTTEKDLYVGFPQTYQAVPIVTVAMMTSGFNRRVNVKISSINGFTATMALLSGTSSADGWFNWISVGRWK